MLLKSFLAVALMGARFAAAETGKLGDAEVVTGNPPDAYTAELLAKPNSNVRGRITGRGAPDGVGVIFDVDFTGFPPSGGPFLYHLHAAPLDASGNCSSALAHLDPYQRGEVTDCDPTQPQTCQTGDLSGKYGLIHNVSGAAHFKAHYLDPYSATKNPLGSFFGNLSVVVHFHNKSRITCANFTMVKGQLPTGTPTAGPRPTGTGPPIFEGNAAKISALSGAGIFAVVIGLLL